MGLALWIVPPESVRSKLKEIMDNPPLEPDIEHPLPSFEPHITLASVHASVTPEMLEQAIPHFAVQPQIDFESVEAQQTYFRSVIVKIRSTSELAQLLDAVRGSLKGAEIKAPHYPHMSLYYIEDVRAVDRQRLIDNFFKTGHFKARRETGELIINCSPDDVSNASELRGFLADAIWVVRCEGPVNGWKVLLKRSI